MVEEQIFLAASRVQFLFVSSFAAVRREDAFCDLLFLTVYLRTIACPDYHYVSQ